MMKRTAILVAAVLAVAAAPAVGQVRAKAELACEATEQRLAYQCSARIADMASGDPLDGLTVEVKADMPSMPMAHNIPPVMAEPTGEPGVYAFAITLDMFGSWAFSMRLSGAREDLLVEVLDFQAGDDDAGADDDHHDHHDHDDHSH